MPVEYYDAQIICSDGAVVGGYTGRTEEEAWERAAAVVNTGELFPGAVKIRTAKCIFIREQLVTPSAESYAALSNEAPKETKVCPILMAGAMIIEIWTHKEIGNPRMVVYKSVLCLGDQCAWFENGCPAHEKAAAKATKD